MRIAAHPVVSFLCAMASGCAVSGCTVPPPPAAPPPTPVPEIEAPPPSPDPEPTADLPVHECGQDPAKESPIVEGKLGDGERMVRLINNSGVAIQARILGEDLEAAVAGTLHVRAGKRGEFHVPEGNYVVRYRHGTTCEVRRGAKLLLTGRRTGVEIGVKPGFDRGSDSRMKKVSEEL
jgi:hypothetical protein